MVLICFFLSGYHSLAQDTKSLHPIDKRLEACHDKEENQTTYGMIGCESKAAEEWDGELNRYYKLLMGQLTDGQKESLRVSQRQWIKFRDAENLFSADLHYSLDGSLWRIVAVQRSKDIVRSRALVLKSYYETLIDNQ